MTKREANPQSGWLAAYSDNFRIASRAGKGNCTVRRLRRISTAGALLAVLCAGVNTLAAEGALSGIVLDAQGRSIASATIKLSQDGASEVSTATTNSDGRFVFAGVEPGHYRLSATANGFQSFARDVAIGQTNQDLKVTLDLAPVQSSVTVQGDQEGMLTAPTTSGSLTPTPILDLPQSVQVATRQLLDEQAAYQYADALSYLPGVQRSYTSIAGAVGNEVAMRGFQLDFSNNYLRDGYKFYGLSLTDTADIEQVEVLKGPASALYGTAEAGGVVNLISKKPTDTPFISLGMSGGSYQYLRPDFDISGPLNSGQTLFYRVNGVYENTDTFRTYAHSEKYFIAPYFLWRPSSSTSLSVSGEFINANRNSDYGLALLGDRPAPVPVSTSYTEPWNNEDDRDRQAGYRFSHTFKSGWTLNNGLLVARTNARYFEVYTTGPDTDPTQLTRMSDAFYFPTLYRYSQTSLVGSLKTGPVRHHIAVGFEAGWTDASSEGPGGYAPNVSVLNPVVGTDFSESDAAAALANPYFSLTYQTKINTQAGYAQDQIDLGRHWKVLAGFRVERYFQDSINTADNSHQTQTDVPISPRAGVVYQPKSWVSLYGSYVRSFIPTSPNALSASGKQFSPEHDSQWETGIKVAPGAGRLNGTIALFDIRKDNVLAPDPENQLFSVQNGKVRSKGVEFEFRGNLRSGLDVLASYAFIQAQVTESVVYPVGNLLPNAPRHSGAMWMTYRAPSGPFRRLGLSAGVITTVARQDNYYNTALLPGYARLDVGAFYEIPVGDTQKVRLSLNIQNALDRTYYLASNGWDQVRPGSPLAALVALKWNLR